ncbi:MAG: GldG family protein [Myxococcota bacterium]|nr:GldG family protein [Myxococcota bacterium]
MTPIATLLGAIGLVLFGFGLVQFVIFIFQPIMDPLWLWAHLGLGALMILASVGMSLDGLRERMRSGEGRRAGRYGTSALLQAVLLLGILCGVAFLGERYSKRFDWTEQQVHTLSEQTQNLLDGLETGLHITGFYNSLDQPIYRQLLERYATSGNVTFEFADPNARPDLVEAYGLDAEALPRGLLHVAYGDASVVVNEFGESEITNAIVKLTRSGGRRVYFATGHNERASLGEAAEEPNGLSRAVAALRNETYEVAELRLAVEGRVPDDADVVILAGPTRPLLDVEHAALRSYIASGGAVFAMLDPRSNTDLADDLLIWGIVVGENVVFDRSLALFGRATSPFAASYAENHPITRDFAETTLFHMARTLEPGPDASGLTSLVRTGDSSWAETNLGDWTAEGVAGYDADADSLGPVSLGVVGVPVIDAAPERDPRIVAIGDSDFATNELIDGFMNRDLFVNSVAWLMGEVEHIAIRPNTSRASRFQLTAEQFLRIQMLSLFVLPETIAIVGVLAWWSRRRGLGR